MELVDKIKSNIYYPHTEVTLVRAKEFKITLHFPRITIKNQVGLSHTIRDLFVWFSITVTPEEDAFIISDYELRGTRTTFTTKEANLGYYHSHLPSSLDLDDEACFCLGDDDVPINEAFTGGYKHTLDSLQYLVELIENLVVWESLEGVPYRYIKNLKKKDSVLGNRIYNPSLRGVKNFLKVIPVQVTQSDEEFKVTIDLLKLEEGKQTFSNDIRTTLWGIESEGWWHFPSEASRMESMPLGVQTRVSMITFKGKNYPRRILQDTVESVEELSETVNKSVCTHLEKEWTSQFNTFIKKKTVVNRIIKRKSIL